jgi:hypothetical protein
VEIWYEPWTADCPFTRPLPSPHNTNAIVCQTLTYASSQFRTHDPKFRAVLQGCCVWRTFWISSLLSLFIPRVSPAEVRHISWHASSNSVFVCSRLGITDGRRRSVPCLWIRRLRDYIEILLNLITIFFRPGCSANQQKHTWRHSISDRGDASICAALVTGLHIARCTVLLFQFLIIWLFFVTSAMCTFSRVYCDYTHIRVCAYICT